MTNFRNVNACAAPATRMLATRRHGGFNLYTCERHRKILTSATYWGGLSLLRPTVDNQTCGTLIDRRPIGRILHEHFRLWLGGGGTPVIGGSPIQWRNWIHQLRGSYQDILDGISHFPADVVDCIDLALGLAESTDDPAEVDEALESRILAALADAETRLARTLPVPV